MIADWLGSSGRVYLKMQLNHEYLSVGSVLGSDLQSFICRFMCLMSVHSFSLNNQLLNSKCVFCDVSLRIVVSGGREAVTFRDRRCRV